MFSFAQFGNDLYSGKKSFDFVGKRKIWFTISAIAVVLAILIPVLRGGFNLGLEFRGGSQFEISNAATTNTSLATTVVNDVLGSTASVPQVTVVGGDGLQIQTDTVTTAQSDAIVAELASVYGVSASDISASVVGASWGASVTQKAIWALIIFLTLVTILMALYFRTLKMSAAALVALLHDLIITAGVYAATGFEVTPPAVIGFLTILGYSLYDTVVVFDKIRENTKGFKTSTRLTFVESVNLAINQTLVRSINTSTVAILPVASILFIGAFLLGAGTLRDISLALLIGILVGTYSTIFIASPLYAQFRLHESAVVEQAKKVEKVRAAALQPA